MNKRKSEDEPCSSKSIKASSDSPFVKNDVEDMFKDFENLYKESNKNFLDTKHDLNEIKEYYTNYEDFKKKENEKIVIANFGYPGNHKSSSLNYFMTGTTENPLLNSLATDAEGVTLKPTRLEYFDLDKIEVAVIKKDKDELDDSKKRFKEFNNSYKECIKEIMKDPEIDEIQIFLPKRYMPECFGKKLENVVFYDLIGVNEDESDDITVQRQKEKFMFELNKKVVERNHIDAILIYPGSRNKCTYNIIKHLWMCAIFSEKYSIRPPKLIIARKIRKNHQASDWTNSKELSDLLEGFCQSRDINVNGFILESIHKSIKSAFCSDKEENELEETLCMNKVTKNICELVKRASTLCILEISNPQDEYEKEQFKKFQDQITKHLTEIKDYKNDFYISESIAYARIVCTKLSPKLKSLEKSKSDKVSRIINERQDFTDKLNSCNNQIRKELEYFKETSLLVKIDNETDDEDDDDEQFSNNIKESFNQNEDFEDFIEKIVNIHLKFYSFITDRMNKMGINTHKVTYTSIKDDLQITFRSYHLQLSKQVSPNILEKIEIKEEYKWKNVQETFVELISNLNDLETDLKKLYQSKREMEEDKDWKNDIKPMLDESKLTLKIPSAECSFNIEQINKFIRTYPKKKPKRDFNELMEKGKLKSELSLEFENKDCDYVQFELDYENKAVSCSYDENKLKNKLKKLIECINVEKEKAFYPIFISSRYDDGREVNMHLEDLTKISTREGFMIFLFIENDNSDDSKKELENYNKICKIPGLNYNPVTLCYFPTRDLGIGRKRKLMMLFAEHLQKISGLRRVYFLDDDIEEFYQYNRNRGKRCYEKTNICHALNFMRAVLDTELNKQEVTVPTDEEIENWRKAAYRIIINDEITPNLSDAEKADLNDLIPLMKSVMINKDKILDLLTKIDRLEREFKQMKDHLSGISVKYIGNVALHNINTRSNITYKFRLDKENDNIRTHFVSGERYCVLLLNMDAMKGIHPVTDAVLFEETLNKDARKELLKGINSKTQEFNTLKKNVLELARLGYKHSDKMSVFYQIFNNVNGFQIYYYSFKEKKQASLVNEQT